MKSPVHIICTVSICCFIYLGKCTDMNTANEDSKRYAQDVFQSSGDSSGNMYTLDIKDLLKSHMPAFNALLHQAGRQMANENSDNFQPLPPYFKTTNSESLLSPKAPSKKIKHLHNDNQNTPFAMVEYAPERQPHMNGESKTDEKIATHLNNEGDEMSGSALTESVLEYLQSDPTEPVAPYLDLEFDSPANKKQSIAMVSSSLLITDVEKSEETNPLLSIVLESLNYLYNNSFTSSLQTISTDPVFSHKKPMIISPTSVMSSRNFDQPKISDSYHNYNFLEDEHFFSADDSILRSRYKLLYVTKDQFLVHSLPYSSKLEFLNSLNLVSSADWYTRSISHTPFNIATNQETRLPKVMNSLMPPVVHPSYPTEENTHLDTTSNHSITTTLVTLRPPVDSIITSSYNDFVESGPSPVFNSDFGEVFSHRTILTPSFKISVDPTLVYTLPPSYGDTTPDLYETISDNYFTEELYSNSSVDNFVTPSSNLPASLWLPDSFFVNISHWSVVNRSDSIDHHLLNNRLTTVAAVGIVLGVVGFLLIIGFIIVFLYRRGTTIKKISDYDDSISYWDDNLTLSYVNGHVELPKETREEMISLDNDSFLKSLEKLDGITIANYWAHNSKNTQL